MALINSPAGALPRWDLSGVFPGPDSPELERAHDALVREIADLGEAFDRYGIEGAPSTGFQAPSPRADSAQHSAEMPRVRDPGSEAAAFNDVTGRLNRILEALRVVQTYLVLLVSVDSQNDR